VLFPVSPVAAVLTDAYAKIGEHGEAQRDTGDDERDPDQVEHGRLGPRRHEHARGRAVAQRQRYGGDSHASLRPPQALLDRLRLLLRIDQSQVLVAHFGPGRINHNQIGSLLFAPYRKRCEPQAGKALGLGNLFWGHLAGNYVTVIAG
jgi:hypothetical protein